MTPKASGMHQEAFFFSSQVDLGDVWVSVLGSGFSNSRFDVMVRCRSAPRTYQSSETNGLPGMCSLYDSGWKLPEGQGLAQTGVPSLTPIFHCPDQVLWPPPQWGREILICASLGGQGSRWRPKGNNNQIYLTEIVNFPWHRCLDNCSGPCTFTEASLFFDHFGFFWNTSVFTMKIPSSKQVFIKRKAMRAGTFWVSF